jgi:Bacterial pre-peptidase C-terminal domain
MTSLRTKQANRVTENLGSLTESGFLQNSVGRRNKSDIFQFSLSNRTRFSASLTDLRSNANLQLLNKRNKPIASSNNRSLSSEQFSAVLAPGTYYLKVKGVSNKNTPFTLSYNLAPASGSTTNAVNPINLVPGRTEADYALLSLQSQNAAVSYYLNGNPSGYEQFTAINNQLLEYGSQGDSLALEFYQFAKASQDDAYYTSLIAGNSFSGYPSGFGNYILPVPTFTNPSLFV